MTDERGENSQKDESDNRSNMYFVVLKSYQVVFTVTWYGLYGDVCAHLPGNTANETYVNLILINFGRKTPKTRGIPWVFGVLFLPFMKKCYEKIWYIDWLGITLHPSSDGNRPVTT